MFKFVSEHKWFYGLWLSFMVLGSAYFFVYDKGDFNLYFNCNKNYCLDFIFKNATHIAEFYVSMVVVLFLFAYRVSYGIFYLINAFLISLIVYFLKAQIFNAPRPFVYFKPYFELDPVQGVPLLQKFSFPSGHSTFAFGSMLILAIAMKNKWFSLFCFVLAICTALSRIYLLQHFYEDIYAGAFLGVIITTINYGLAQKYLIDSPHKALKYSFFHQFFNVSTR